MFKRIMAMVLAVILLITVGLTLVCGIELRNRQIESRLNYLISEAGDIAYLAAKANESDSMIFGFPAMQNNVGRDALNRKADEVNKEFGAYIAVVDRRGNLMDNRRVTVQEDPTFAASLSSKEISEALQRILTGESISVRTMVEGSPVFTVGVPYKQDDVVLGAVFIQTKAQMVETNLFEVLKMVVPVGLAAILVGILLVSLYVRSVLKPIKSLTAAAQGMADGNFKIRVNDSKGDKDIRAVSNAFNTMADKLEAVENNRREFVANVSHELRSPITSIKGFVEGMADGVIPAEEHPKYLKLVAQESKRLSDLVGALLALSRLEREDAKPEYSDFDLNEVFRMAVIRNMNVLDEKDLDVECLFDQEPCMVRADQARIEQVVGNLLDNAIKFSFPQGKIELKTSVVNNLCTAAVRDYGAGILPEDKPHVFERFFTADRAHTAGKGTGLGLSICQRIMEMHGQTIRLMDTDEGTLFEFTLEPSNGKELEAHGTEGSERRTESD